ncbi:MAG: hypothetical protein HOP18_26100 [Deltaproteobacteria bacterium]|nr:hypothetical protein [Deltaproteobacteria bacterium]
MAYFHATAVFETRGASQEEADRAAGAAFKSVRHPRVHFYEHDTNGGLGPFPPGKSLYFTTIAEFDVEASREEQAGEIADEVLDALSTEAAQYLGLGIVPGSQRVSPEQRLTPEEEPAEEEPDADVAELEEPEERDGKGRRPRGRRRKRGSEREARPLVEERGHEEEPPAPVRILPPERPAGVEVVSLEPAVVPPPVARALREEQPPVVSISTLNIDAPRTVSISAQNIDAPQTVSLSDLFVEAAPPIAPPRSSAKMRVTLTVNVKASELAKSDERPLDDSELLALACAEARRRHPELPADVAPESTTSSLPAGDTLFLLTWHFDRPIPSASDAS